MGLVMLTVSSHLLQRTSGEDGVQLQLVRADRQQAERHEQEERQMRQDAVHDAAGDSPVSCKHPWQDVYWHLAGFGHQHVHFPVHKELWLAIALTLASALSLSCCDL